MLINGIADTSYNVEPNHPDSVQYGDSSNSHIRFDQQSERPNMQCIGFDDQSERPKYAVVRFQINNQQFFDRVSPSINHGILSKKTNNQNWSDLNA